MSKLLKERWLKIAGISASDAHKWGMLSENAPPEGGSKIKTFTSSSGQNTAGAEMGFGTILNSNGSPADSKDAIVPKAAELALAMAIQNKYMKDGFAHSSIKGHTFVENTSVNATAASGGQVSAKLTPKTGTSHTGLGEVASGNQIGFKTEPSLTAGGYPVSESDCLESMAATIEAQLPELGNEVLLNILYPIDSNAHTDVIMITAQQSMFGSIDDFIAEAGDDENVGGMKVHEFHMKYKNTTGRVGSMTPTRLAEVCLDNSLGASVGIYNGLASAFANGVLQNLSGAHRGIDHPSDAGSVQRRHADGRLKTVSGGQDPDTAEPLPRKPSMMKRAKGWKQEFASDRKIRKDVVQNPDGRWENDVEVVNVPKTPNSHHLDSIATNADFQAAFTAARRSLGEYFKVRFKHTSYLVDMNFKRGQHTCKTMAEEIINTNLLELIGDQAVSVQVDDFDYDLSVKDSNINMNVSITVNGQTAVPFVISARPSRGSIEINQAADFTSTKKPSGEPSYKAGELQGGLAAGQSLQDSEFNKQIDSNKTGMAKLMDIAASTPDLIMSWNRWRELLGDDFFKSKNLLESRKLTLEMTDKEKAALELKRNKLIGKDEFNYMDFQGRQKAQAMFPNNIKMQQAFLKLMSDMDTDDNDVVTPGEFETWKQSQEEPSAAFTATEEDLAQLDNQHEYTFQGTWKKLPGQWKPEDEISAKNLLDILGSDYFDTRTQHLRMENKRKYSLAAKLLK